MSTDQLWTLYQALNTGRASFEEFVWFVGNETDVPTIISWFKDSTVH